MSAPSMPYMPPPPDPKVESEVRQQEAVQQQQLQQEERQQEVAIQREEAAVQQAELADLRGSASNQGRSNANNYFTSRGLDPTQYSSDIDSVINNTLMGIDRHDPNPGSYFTNAGETAFNAAQTGARSRAGREIDRLFSPNFESSRIPFTIDDPYLAGIESEQRSKADQIIQNMLSRRVITDTGAAAARGDLDRQAPGVRSRLNEVGTGTVAQGQQRLRDIAGRGRSTASGLELGNTFNANTFGSEADQAFNDFIGTLGDTLRSKAPGNLFSTAGLGAIAGAGQGAQNTAFNPNAAAGGPPASTGNQNDDEEENADSIF